MIQFTDVEVCMICTLVQDKDYGNKVRKGSAKDTPTGLMRWSSLLSLRHYHAPNVQGVTWLTFTPTWKQQV
uniref:Uncharacterized protein LOC105133892 n=1 Tax=Rhizophora mucronata TaxID=61149 RepID=A0A2P2PLJ8_RHIMU